MSICRSYRRCKVFFRDYFSAVCYVTSRMMSNYTMICILIQLAWNWKLSYSKIKGALNKIYCFVFVFWFFVFVFVVFFFCERKSIDLCKLIALSGEYYFISMFLMTIVTILLPSIFSVNTWWFSMYFEGHVNDTFD